MGYNNGYSSAGDYYQNDPEEERKFFESQRLATMNNNGMRDAMGGMASGQVMPAPQLSPDQMAIAKIQELNSTLGADKKRSLQNIFDAQYKPSDKGELAAAKILPVFNQFFDDGTGVNTSAQDAAQLTKEGIDNGLATRRAMDQKQAMMLQSLSGIVDAFGRAGPSDLSAYHAADVRSRMFNDFSKQAESHMQQKQAAEQMRMQALMASYGHNVPGSSAIPSQIMGDGAQGTAAHAAFLGSRGIQEYGPSAANSWESIDAAKQKEQDQLTMQSQQEMAQIKNLLMMGMAGSARQQTFNNGMDAAKVAALSMGLGPQAQAAQIKAENPPPAKPEDRSKMMRVEGQTIMTEYRKAADDLKQAEESVDDEKIAAAQERFSKVEARLHDFQARGRAEGAGPASATAQAPASPATPEHLKPDTPEYNSYAEQLFAEALKATGGDKAKAAAEARKLAKQRGFKL